MFFGKLISIFSVFGGLAYLDFFSALLGGLFVLIYKPFDKSFKLIVWFILFQAIILLSIFVTNIYMQGKSNIYLYQINALVSFVLLGSYFMQELKVFNKKIFRKTYVIITILLLLFMIFFEDRKQLNSYSYGIVSLLISVFSFAYYARLLNNPETTVIYRTPEFWIVTGLLLYYSLCMFIFLPYKTLTRLNYKFVQNHFFDLWIFQNIIYFVMIVLFIKGFSCKKFLKIQ